jgi:hypothetical protein
MVAVASAALAVAHTTAVWVASAGTSALLIIGRCTFTSSAPITLPTISRVRQATVRAATLDPQVILDIICSLLRGSVGTHMPQLLIICLFSPLGSHHGRVGAFVDLPGLGPGAAG